MARTIRIARALDWYWWMRENPDEDDAEWLDRLMRDRDQGVASRKWYKGMKHRERRAKERDILSHVIKDPALYECANFPHERKTMEWDLF